MVSRALNRLPVGSLISISPAGTQHHNLLTDKLIQGGLPSGRVISQETLQHQHGLTCKFMRCKVIPKSCTHFSAEVETSVERSANTFLAAGQTWLLQTNTPSIAFLQEQIARAHNRGLSVVALRPVTRDGHDLPMETPQTLPGKSVNDIRAAHQLYEQLTVTQLYEMGFDVVIEWDEDSVFETFPEAHNATHLDSSKVVVVGDLHGLADTFFDKFLPAIGTDKELSNPNVLLVSVGDIHDKGPNPQTSVELIRWWLWAIRTGRALMVDSNHSRNLVQYLTGRKETLSPSGMETLEAIEEQPDAQQIKDAIVTVFSRLPSHLVFTDLVVVHAAMRQELIGTTNPRARGFILHARNEHNPWEWNGPQTLVHGHDTVPQPTRRRSSAPHQGHTPGEAINVDTGAVTGGPLTGYVNATDSFIQVTPYAHEVKTLEMKSTPYAEVAFSASA